MRILFLEEAQQELFDAISFYEEACVGLGRRFKDELDRCILWIAEHPELYNLRHGVYRRINLRSFPYYVAFIDRESAIWILAVAHASRRPTYWISRRPGDI